MAAVAFCAGVATVSVALVLALGPGAEGGRSAGGGAPLPSAVNGCRGKQCDGKDPGSMYCGGGGAATLLERTSSTGERVEIRYNPTCAAAWGRISNGRIGDRVELTVPGAPPRSVDVTDAFAAADTLLTPMVAAENTEALGEARLCLEPTGGGARQCFRP